MLVVVAGLLAVDVVFLSCWIAIDPLQAEEREVRDLDKVRHTHSSLLTLKISARSPFELKNLPN